MLTEKEKYLMESAWVAGAVEGKYKTFDDWLQEKIAEGITVEEFFSRGALKFEHIGE